MNDRIFLFSDLDRTLLPNGEQEESAAARPRLRRLSRRQEVSLAYVSGRHLALILEGLEAWQIPQPDYVIADVGTSIYARDNGGWALVGEWAREIATDWGGRSSTDLARLLDGLQGLEPQEDVKQNTYKLSYYLAGERRPTALLATVRSLLDAEGIRASVIWSVDDAEKRGLLDLLPESANKLHAIRFLMQREGFPEDRTVFAGDSGNDLDVLQSGLRAILVRNARDEVREEAIASLEARGLQDRLYLARGGFLGMNGNYAAGVLEGVAHFFGEVAGWLAETPDGSP